MNQSFLFFELIGVFIMHWLILAPQTYVVVEQSGAENIPLLSGRLVSRFFAVNSFNLNMNAPTNRAGTEQETEVLNIHPDRI